jgi:hypothetical protein
MSKPRGSCHVAADAAGKLGRRFIVGNDLDVGSLARKTFRRAFDCVSWKPLTTSMTVGVAVLSSFLTSPGPSRAI